jgi:hypothetical protein
MKCAILLALVAAASAGVIAPAHLVASHAALVNTGNSAQFRTQDNVGNYAFGYNEDHSTGGTFRRESGDAHGNKVGSYGLRDADGRLRIVNYVADAAGFRANIQSNEPGVEPKDPASVIINKPGLVAAAPILAEPAIHAPVIAAAPLHHAPQYVQAPVAHVAPANYYNAPLHHAQNFAYAPQVHHAGLVAAPAHVAPAYAAPLTHYNNYPYARYY